MHFPLLFEQRLLVEVLDWQFKGPLSSVHLELGSARLQPKEVDRESAAVHAKVLRSRKRKLEDSKFSIINPSISSKASCKDSRHGNPQNTSLF